MSSGSTPSAAARKEGGAPWLDEGEPIPPEDCASAHPGPDLDDIYRRHASRLTRSLWRRTGNRDDALDLVQEAFSRLLRLGRVGSTAIENPEAYLNRAARNLLHNRAKADARRCVHLHVVVDEGRLHGPDQHHLLESRDMLRRLEAVMLKLKPKTRAIFIAHRIDGLSYAEIAERTGLSISGVEKQMIKAIAHIDRMFDRP